MKKLIAIVIACLVIGSAAAEEEKVVIDYSDVDVGTARGADILYGRIVDAAKTVCPAESLLQVHRYLAWRHCVQTAISNAVTEVDSPLLTARHHRAVPATLYSSRATTK